MGLKLYKVTCRGMQSATASRITNGIAYCVAEDPTAAYEALREFLCDNDYGNYADREMETIELVAEADSYPMCGFRLFVNS